MYYHRMKVGIWGSKGFAGQELVKILSRKKQVEVVEVGKEQKIEDVTEEMGYAFLALPTEQSMMVAPELLKRKMYVIDLSGAFRIKDLSVFEKYYGFKHTHPEYINRAVYGLPEKNRESIRRATLVANPGYYATAVELALLPLVENKFVSPDIEIRIEAVSGYMGAGKNAQIPKEITLYKPDREHQHICEIEQILGLKEQIHFYPHIAPWPRGIEAKISLNIRARIDIYELYVKYFSLPTNNPYIMIDTEAKKENVIGTNLCQICPKIKRNGEVEINVALDNLGKGAAGQAVQNLIIINPFFGEKVYDDE